MQHLLLVKEEEKYLTHGNKKIRDGVETEEDGITVKALFQKFEDYCLPNKNLIVERRRFFTRNQQNDETIDSYITQLRN